MVDHLALGLADKVALEPLAAQQLGQLAVAVQFALLRTQVVLDLGALLPSTVEDVPLALGLP